MKKYVKPELFYEHYELSQHIADCNFEYIAAQDVCAAQGDDEDGIGGVLVFNTTPTPCNVEPGKLDIFCYHGSAGVGNLFAS